MAAQTIAKLICLLGFGLLVVPTCMLTTVPLGSVGVRSSNLSGVNEEDLDPGWHLDVPGLHRMTLLPSTFNMLDYSQDDNSALLIRTRDNNNVTVDVSVPYRIIPGQAHLIMKEGYHQPTGDGGFRFQRLAADTTISVLREELAVLTSADFYVTETRLKVAGDALTRLNEKLGPLHLEAESLLIRAVSFRQEYEDQLQAIQLNEQNKLLDGAREKVANQQQELDNFELQTNALVASKEQEWSKRKADLERAYEVGFVVSSGGDISPTAARGALAAMSEEARAALRTEASAILTIPADEVAEPYLLGIQAIQAETLAYRKNVTAEADGIAARLGAESDALVAAVRGEFEARLNLLLGSPAGRAYVAYQAAANIKFADVLTFQSSDGVPSVLRLRAFAEQFMGR